MFRHNINTLEEGEPKKELPYAEDHEEFLQLVNPHYDDDLLHEWEPAPQTDDLDPEEPGYMGSTIVVIFIFWVAEQQIEIVVHYSSQVNR